VAGEFTVELDDDFVAIAREVVDLGLTPDEWAGRESDDEFQTGRYVGGFDADENAFLFRAVMSDGTELWFDLTLSEMFAVADGRLRSVSAEPGDDAE